MIKTINSWRGLMAVTVVLFHAGVGWIWNIAVTGVTFFFISSTFLLALHHPFDVLNAKKYKHFVINHALRLYPLHWLGLLMLVPLILSAHQSIDWGNFTLTALLLQAWSPIHEVHYAINPVTWYMCALLFCYFAHPFIAHWMFHWDLWRRVLLAGGLALLLALLLVPFDLPGREAIFVNPLSHIVDIPVGLTFVHLLAMLKSRYPRVGFWTATCIEVATLLSLAIAIGLNLVTTWFKPWEDLLIWLIPQGSILIAMAYLDGQEGALGRLLLTRPLQWLGSISFEIYVLHYVTFYIFNYYLCPVAGHFGWMIYDKLAWYCLFLTLPMAWLFNRYFTEPVTTWLKRVL
ncbi:MAG: acyltransferase [Muribaculaceae bacterium]|nr:acyltransferase [Muribaculaceae bacterium]